MLLEANPTLIEQLLSLAYELERMFNSLLVTVFGPYAGWAKMVIIAVLIVDLLRPKSHRA